MVPIRARIQALLVELKRRRVIRVAAVYGVAGWIVIQVGATVFPALYLPEWTVTFVVVLVLLGLPITLVLAWIFDFTAEGVRRTSPEPVPSEVDLRPGTLPLALGTLLAVVILLPLAGWMLLNREARSPPVLPGDDVVAVLPFRVSGDPALAYLSEGMVDLLAAKLTGDAGPRALEPRTLLSALRRAGHSSESSMTVEDAASFARGLGANQVLLGELISVPPQLVLSARLVDVSDRAAVGRASVEGPSDGLTTLTDQLAARLLLVHSGEGDETLESLTTWSLPALRLYLQGRALQRQGTWEAATDRFAAALDLDSTFVLAAKEAWVSMLWGVQRGDLRERVERIAWGGRDRLSERDRLHLLTMAGPDHPLPPTAWALLEIQERAVSVAPDRAELWFELGDNLFHDGGRLGVPSWKERAISALERAVALDPEHANAEAFMHLAELLADEGDLERLRGWVEPFLARHPEGDVALYLRWILDVLDDDTDGIEAARERLAGIPWRPSRWIMQNAQLLGRGLNGDAEMALERVRRAALSPDERRTSLAAESRYFFNAGRPSEALNALGRAFGTNDGSGSVWRWANLAYLFWDGRRDEAVEAARALEAQGRAVGPDSAAQNGSDVRSVCALALWWATEGQVERAQDALPALRSPPAAAGEELRRQGRTCGAMVEGLLTLDGQGDPGPAATALDRVFRDNLTHFSWDPLFSAAPLVLSRLHEADGNLVAALAAARRRPYGGGTHGILISTFLKEEGRLAALNGDRADAVRAYRHFLALRPNPEDHLMEEVERIRRELDQLARSP